jgi:general secretion pathway protein J
VAVTYRIAEKDKKSILTRQERDLFSEEATIPAFPQMEQISSFLVECSSDGSKWVKTWDSANQGLPRFVRVTVQVEEEGKPVEFSVLSSPQVSGS